MRLRVVAVAVPLSVLALLASCGAAHASAPEGADVAPSTRAPLGGSDPRAHAHAHAGVAAAVSYGVTNSAHAELFRAIEIRALAAPTRFADLGVVSAVEEGLIDGEIGEALAYGGYSSHHIREHAFTDVRTGLTASWGAPWAGRRWGFGLDLGVSAGFATSARYVSPWGGAQLRFALCTCASLRPMVAWSGRAVPLHYGHESVQSTGLDLGLAFTW
jgi:hypothetical protein